MPSYILVPIDRNTPVTEDIAKNIKDYLGGIGQGQANVKVNANGHGQGVEISFPGHMENATYAQIIRNTGFALPHHINGDPLNNYHIRDFARY